MAGISEMQRGDPLSVELRAGDLRLELVPEIGGSIAAFRKGEIHLLRPLSPENRSRRNVLGVGSFPMLPYANRIDGNEFVFEDQAYRFRANNGGERFSVHGTGWQSVWTVEAQSATTARLVLDYAGTGAGPAASDGEAIEDPYSYRATQSFDLSAQGLTLATTIENRGARRMPFGFGHHPWFERDRDVELTFTAKDFWLEGPEGVPSSRIVTPPELDFTAGAPLPEGWRNNCYSGWSGRAELRFPTRGVRLAIEADPVFGSLMFYADPKQSFFCLEPQTNVPCAFNKQGDDLGVIVLNPGERSEGVMRWLVG